MWLILSDILPLTAFLTHACLIQHRPTKVGVAVAASRALSLLYHCSSSEAHMINLDYIGICMMALAAMEVNERSVMCPTTQFILVACFGCCVAGFSVAFWRKMVYDHSQRCIVVLAAVGHMPSLRIILSNPYSHTSNLLLFSTVTFAVGYFAIKPAHHTAWHWAAAAAQVAVVMACEAI